MEVIVRPTAELAVQLVVQLVEARVQAKPTAVLGLATGRTMEQVYQSLAAGRVSFAGCTSFNLDEYIGINSDSPHSYRHYMDERFFSLIDIKPERTHLPDGSATDLKTAAADYEMLIEQAGGIDLQLLGIGVAGHIGFNEPLSSLMSLTRDKSLTRTTREQNAPLFGGDIEQVPKRALTMGVGTILGARELVLLATGPDKANIIAKAVEGPVTSMVSASALQLHANCKVIVDAEAAAALQGREYYEFVFHNEPEWAAYRS